MLKQFTLFGLLFIASFTFGQSTVTGSFEHDGVLRTYRVYIPDIYDGSRPTPLVFNLHGYGSNNISQEAYGDLRPVADTANFIIVHPQGLTDDLSMTHWNTFGTSTVDDVDFLSQLIDTIYAHYNIDGNRIYSTGMSNGGFMSYKLACLLSGRIAAVASVAGSIHHDEIGQCITNHPMPVMQIHGTADETVPFDGSFISLPIDEVLEHWVTFNQCDPDPIVTEIADTDPDDGCTVTHYRYANGLLGSEVELYKVEDGGHTWPGASVIFEVTNNDFNASAEIWRFFSQYTLNHLTSSIAENTEKPVFVLAPNPTQSGQTTLTFAKATERKIAVYNALGQEINALVSSEPTVQIQLPHKGIYLISVTENGQTATQKLIRN